MDIELINEMMMQRGADVAEVNRLKDTRRGLYAYRRLYAHSNHAIDDVIGELDTTITERATHVRQVNRELKEMIGV